MAFMEIIFWSHIGLAYTSLGLLLLRGVLSAKMVDWRQNNLLRITPHIVDTLLLISGITLFIAFGASFQSWIFAKLFFLVLYIVFAAKAFKKGRRFSIKHFLLAVISFMLVLLTATVK
ncbi:SirB2 family protein [Glaesserella sp.]|uniref:SirB2 family protein n=1 Tax=Glaesserella sp. TaxID=2094731 RepID=UPI00359FE9E7